jgi:hypothetical protein
MAATFTLIDTENGSTTEVDAELDGERVLVGPGDVARATGWVLKPEGLCRDAVCVPLRDATVVTAGGRIDLEAFAAALHRPVAIDADELCAALGVAAEQRAEQLRGMEAPDFTLPDLTGRSHSLSEHRGRKVLLLAYASW